MQNEGPIKCSLQRQRPHGHEKPPPTPPPPHPPLPPHSMSRIFTKWIAEELRRTHTRPPNECSIFDFLYGFFWDYYSHAWARGVQWTPCGTGGDKAETPPIRGQDPCRHRDSQGDGVTGAERRDEEHKKWSVTENNVTKSVNVSFQTALWASSQKQLLSTCLWGSSGGVWEEVLDWALVPTSPVSDGEDELEGTCGPLEAASRTLQSD